MSLLRAYIRDKAQLRADAQELFNVLMDVGCMLHTGEDPQEVLRFVSAVTEVQDWGEFVTGIHPTADLETPWGESAPIDVHLVPLVQALWSEGIVTVYSCQGDDTHEAYVSIHPDSSLTSALDILQTFGIDVLYTYQLTGSIALYFSPSQLSRSI